MNWKGEVQDWHGFPRPRHTSPLRRRCTAGKTISVEYTTEYSTDKIEMHSDAVKPGQRVLLLDDLIATGGTLGAP